MKNDPIEIESPAEQERLFKKLKAENDADLKMEMTTLADGPAKGTEMLIPHGVYVVSAEVEGNEYIYIRSARLTDTFLHLRTDNSSSSETGVQ